MQEGELVTRLLQADCHLPLQERILGGYFSRGYGGMPNATKSMASAVCICNSGLDCLWAWLLYAMCSSDVCLPGMLQFTRYSMVMIIAFVFCEFFLAWTLSIQVVVSELNTTHSHHTHAHL